MKLVGKLVAALAVVVVVLAVGFLGWANLKPEPDFSAHPKPAVVASSDPVVIARGEYLVHAVAHCSVCHGPAENLAQRKLADDLRDLRGGRAMAAGPFGTFYPSNLTSDRDTGIGAVDDATLARAIRHGVARDGRFAAFMRLAVGNMSDEDLTAVVSYLRTVPPVKHEVPRDEWGLVAKAIAGDFAPRADPPPPHVPEGGVSVERGRYLAQGPALCVGCHTIIDPMNGFAVVGPELGGGEPEPDPFEDGLEVVAPNLTSGKGGVTSLWSEDQFLARFRAGAAFKGTKMPWESFAKMTDDDVRSIYRYLKSAPPVDRDVGPTRRPAGWQPGA